MAQNFMPLFYGVLGVLYQIVVSNAASYCQDYSPIVRVCEENSVTATIVYVDTEKVPAFVNTSCLCTLNIDHGNQNVDMKVRLIREYTSDIDIFINNNKVIEEHTFSYTPGMAVKFQISEAKDIAQCYIFEIVTSSAAEKIFRIKCAKVVNSETTTTPHGIAESTSPGTGETSASRDTNRTQRPEPSSANTGVIAGAAGGGLAVVVVVVIITVLVCKRRGASDKARKQDAPDIYNEEPDYNLTTNAGYVSADDCQRETDNATEHDPRGYTLVNKPRPKQHPTQQTVEEDDNYNHLNDVLHTHNPANVYNTRAEATAEPDTDDYNRLNKFRKPNETDNVYNVSSSNANPSNEYDRTNVPTRNVPADYEYSTCTPNKVYKP